MKLPVAIMYHSLEDSLQLVFSSIMFGHEAGGERFTSVNNKWKSSTAVAV